jgi:hypothetical protein
LNYKDNKGVTMVALIVSVIAMLILVSISLGAVIGEGSIFYRASAGTEIYKEGATIEVIEEMMTKYQTSSYAFETDGLQNFLTKQKDDKRIEDFEINEDKTVKIVKDGKNFLWYQEGKDGTNYKVKKID